MTTVTVNTRLARQMRRRRDREHEARGDDFWEAPDILSFRAWVRRLWEEAVYTAKDARVLLSPSQELVLWEQVIRSSDEAEELLNPEGTAEVAAQAWLQLYTWKLPRNEAVFEEVPDTAAFFRWMQQFQSALARRGFITEAEVPGALLKAGFERPDRYAGFEELTPIERDLFADSDEVELPLPVNPSRRQCGLADVQEEIRSAAYWARGQLEQNPNARVGVVFPDLAARRTAVSRVFAEILGTADAFHISAPVPLTEVPLVQTAVLALKACSGLSVAEVGQLLRSPYFRLSAQEGAREDLALRRRGISRFVKKNEEVPDDPQRPDAWSGIFSKVVAMSGWPGTRSLNSYEYQATESWKKLLSEFAKLDAVLGELSFDTAVSRLEKLAAKTGFGAEEEDEPVQIMGMPEAAGSRFDALWIGGLHDGVWPPAARPHPFLPLSLQRAARTPNSSVDLQFLHARRTMGALLRSAVDVVCSYPERDSEAALRASPILKGMPMRVDRSLAKPAQYRLDGTLELEGRVDLEAVEDEQAPPLGTERFVKGGMSVIADQSACPFRAFARHRLGARGMDEVEPGLTDRERGNVAHNSLQTIWESLRTQKELLVRDRLTLSELVEQSVRIALQEKLGEGSRSLNRIQALEVRRLSGILLEWLDLEKNRPGFETRQIEVRQRYELGGLELEIRADRVDQYTDGSLAILDYKTGTTAKVTQWDTVRPEAPQLPIYSITMQEPVSTIAFAQLAAEDVKLKGVSECGDSGLKPGKSLSLKDQIEKWRGIVHRLGSEFVAGQAAVNPTKCACEFCDLKGFCRIAETGEEASDG